MASVSQGVVERPTPRFGGRGGVVDKYFYIVMALATAGLVVWRFSQTVGGNLIHATPARPWLLWVHGAAFSGWVAFYLLQTSLVRVKKVKLHRTLGWVGVGLAAVMVPLGVAVSLVMGHFDLTMEHAADAPLFELVGLYDMVAFGTLVTLAIVWRKKPQWHRPLMFIATCGLLDAAYGRFDYIFAHHLFYWCVDGTILLGVVRDAMVDGTVNKVYRWAVPVLVAVHCWVIWTVTKPAAWWARAAHALMG